MPPRFAFVKTPAWAEADADMREMFAGFVAALGERAVEIDIPELGDVMEWQRIVQLAENAHYYGPLMQQAPELVSPGLTQRLDDGPRHRRAGSICAPSPAASRRIAALPRR